MKKGKLDNLDVFSQTAWSNADEMKILVDKLLETGEIEVDKAIQKEFKLWSALDRNHYELNDLEMKARQWILERFDILHNRTVKARGDHLASHPIKSKIYREDFTPGTLTGDKAWHNRCYNFYFVVRGWYTKQQIYLPFGSLPQPTLLRPMHKDFAEFHKNKLIPFFETIKSGKTKYDDVLKKIDKLKNVA